VPACDVSNPLGAGEGKDIELRHQRNPDVTFECLVSADGAQPAGSWQYRFMPLPLICLLGSHCHLMSLCQLTLPVVSARVLCCLGRRLVPPHAPAACLPLLQLLGGLYRTRPSPPLKRCCPLAKESF
jgi:hypothetical protein